MKANHILLKNLCCKLSMAALLATALVPTYGQTPADTTLNRTVIVEQEYNPEIIDARKINALPKVEEITVSPNKMEYDGAAVPASSMPGSIMSIYAAKERQEEAKRGYARLGYGNYGNLDARAGYLFSLSARDKLGLHFGMDGMDGKLDLPESENTWDSYFYRSRARVDYLHRFDKVDMDIAGNFGLSNFNYLPGSELSHQRFTSGGVHFGVKSTGDVCPLNFKLETNLLLYQRGHNWLDAKDRSLTESLVRTKGDVTGDISDNQLIGIAFEMDNKFYNNKALDNNTAVLLNPYYEWNAAKGSIHLGANVDFGFGFGQKLRVSPDVKAKFVFSKSYVLYAEATGGKIINDFGQLELNNPYARLASTVADSYRQVDLKGGFKASPMAGLWFNVYVGYQSFKDDLFHVRVIPQDGDYSYTDFGLSDSHDTNAGVQLSYDYKDIISFLFDGKVYAWEADEEDAYALKPEYTLDSQIKVRPIQGLEITVGHQYARRNEAWNHRIAPINNLYAGLAYTFYKGISVYGRAANLFDKEYCYYLAQPAQGVNFVGGLSFRF